MAEKKTNVDVVWTGGTAGNATIKSTYLDTKLAIPKHLGGSGDGANPKELLVSAATACYVATLTYMLEQRKLPVVQHEIKSEATVSDEDFKVIHYPKITLASDATDEQVETTKEAFDGAEKGCDIGNMLKKAGVTFEIEGSVSKE